MIFSSLPVTVVALSTTLMATVSAAPGFNVDVGEGGEITFSHVTLGASLSVFDTLIHPAQLSNLQMSLASNSEVWVIQGNSRESVISGAVQDIPLFRQQFTENMSEAFSNENLNHYLGFDTFTFDDVFSYELEFTTPLLDDNPAAEDDFTELFFTSRDDNSYMLIEALEKPRGPALSGSTPFLVDTNGWTPASDAGSGGAVAQLDNTALYVRGVDLSMLGVGQAQYFRLSSVSASTPGVTDPGANAAASGLGVTGIQTAVPEPSAALLALIGGISLILRRRI